jgi:ABC-type glutathione transport system ATPase component
MTAVVTLENVSVRYLSAAEPAISDVSLCGEPGELLLLAGPSGCGKSTVMRVVNGLVPNAYRADIAGSVTVGGQDAKGLTIRQFRRRSDLCCGIPAGRWSARRATLPITSRRWAPSPTPGSHIGKGQVINRREFSRASTVAVAGVSR